MVSPSIYLYNTDSIDSYGGIFIRWAGIVRLIKRRTNRVPDYLSGVCYLCEEECFRRIGFFNEDYFLYYEDSDWFTRAKSKNYRFHLIHESKVWHKSSASTKRGDGWGPLKAYYMARNNFLFANRHFKLLPRIIWKTGYLLIGSTLHVLFFIRSFNALRAHYTGIWHGLLKRSGKCALSLK